jgi:hypothetical protein
MCAAVAMLTGCSDDRRIDKAALAETVTVSNVDGKMMYTFYTLDSSDEQSCVEIQANSFETACVLAKEKYIPNLSLAKFELFVVQKELYEQILENDLEYLSTQYLVSPQLYVVLSDEKTLDNISSSKQTAQQIENYILLLKNKNSEVNINSLSIFNNFKSESNKEFYVSYINSNKEINAEILEISQK